ncbi:uncharacterized protein LOC123559699 [Mercenaria mercenaria]|uniref:uncharacterized protein LOC123559699 n=1 Tax=Mercenaria mercenaria TaxID=6596 RepID=UPI00234F8082|nr:uncharacterized protein LOC123559699 [Mercenaria mercenaria]
MISNWKRPVFAISILVISVQLFQILYRDGVLERTQDDKRNQSEQVTVESPVADKSKLVTVVNKALEQMFTNDKKIKESQSKTTKLSSSTSTTTAASNNGKHEEKKSQHKLSTPSPFGKDIVRYEIQAKFAEAIRLWRAEQTRKEKLAIHSKYDGHNLMNDPVFKFDPNFKNPCWFENDQFQCLPYVYVIGVKKSGTTDLFHRMSLHPDFVRPGFKEAQWFARKRFSLLNVFIVDRNQDLCGRKHILPDCDLYTRFCLEQSAHVLTIPEITSLHSIDRECAKSSG